MTRSILVVEDDPDGQMLVSHILHYLNVPFEVVGDAEAAIEKLNRLDIAYQAVIIDLQLPGKDGFELIAEIRDNPASENLICIAVTAYHTTKTRDEVLQAGFNAYFPKPLDATRFAREMEALL